MDETTKQLLLQTVVRAVQEDPSMFTRMVHASQEGLERRASEATDRAADFETATSFLLEYAKKGSRLRKTCMAAALRKIDKWKGRTAINWDFYQKHIDAHNRRDEGERHAPYQ